jgi:hypothetical protein
LETPGSLLEQLLRTVRSELLIVSPFIKVNTLKRILNGVGDDIKVGCVTRWRLEEIIAGVSDLEIWDLLCSRSNSTLSLRFNLHAKYYRGDENCLIGSANITNAALGWSLTPNLELLIPAYKNQDFEKELFTGTIDVTYALYEQYKAAVLNCPKIFVPFKPTIQPEILEEVTEVNFPPDQNVTCQPTRIETWLPTSRNPQNLFIAYSGQVDKLSTAAKETAGADLAILSIPPGLNEEVFNLFVAATINQIPVLYRVNRFVEMPQRFGAVRNLIKQITGIGNIEADTAWQTLMRWLLYFSPDDYEITQPHISEIFRKKSRI